MRITQLGHASLYVETADVRILIDPVLIDPHQEGLFDIFPKRTVRWEALPPFEILFISHNHLDHFDVATLARLPRDVQVVIADDALLVQAFDALGYKTVECVRSFSTFAVDHTRFLVTPSEGPIPEHGLLISDPDGTFWNQVDTVLSAAQIDLVLSQSNRVDLLLATWQPMLELALQHNQPVAFPWMEYGRLLSNAARVQPRALAPGSNGFRYTGDAGWLNHVVFPQSRERFLADVVSMIPDLEGRAFAFDPGDTLELRDGETIFHHRASTFVTSDGRDPFELEFSPATAQRPLRESQEADDDPNLYAVHQLVQKTLPDFIRNNAYLFRSHRDWSVIYQLEVAGTQGSEYWWCDFSKPDPRFERGRTPLANFVSGITASGLTGLINGTCGWDRVMLSGDFYQLHKVYGVWKNGMVLPTHVEILNPLSLIFSNKAAFEAVIRNQLEEAKALGWFSQPPNSAGCDV